MFARCFYSKYTFYVLLHSCAKLLRMKLDFMPTWHTLCGCAACMCVLRLCECVVFMSVSTYVSHFSFITLWHLFMIARLLVQHNSPLTYKGEWQREYGKICMYVCVCAQNYRVVVSLDRLQCRIRNGHSWIHTYIHIFTNCSCARIVCVCVWHL